MGQEVEKSDIEKKIENIVKNVLTSYFTDTSKAIIVGVNADKNNLRTTLFDTVKDITDQLKTIKTEIGKITTVSSTCESVKSDNTEKRLSEIINKLNTPHPQPPNNNNGIMLKEIADKISTFDNALSKILQNQTMSVKSEVKKCIAIPQDNSVTMIDNLTEYGQELFKYFQELSKTTLSENARLKSENDELKNDKIKLTQSEDGLKNDLKKAKLDIEQWENNFEAKERELAKETKAKNDYIKLYDDKSRDLTNYKEEAEKKEKKLSDAKEKLSSEKDTLGRDKTAIERKIKELENNISILEAKCSTCPKIDAPVTNPVLPEENKTVANLSTISENEVVPSNAKKEGTSATMEQVNQTPKQPNIVVERK